MDGDKSSSKKEPAQQEAKGKNSGVPIIEGQLICEGSAECEFPKGEAFYNPVQVYNRDLSTAVIQDFIDVRKKEKTDLAQKHANKKGLDFNPEIYEPEGVNILEALSATGLRAVRYGKELTGVKEIVANDLSVIAARQIKKNIESNNVEHVVTPNCGEASAVMFQRRAGFCANAFDVIDLDPYGTAAPFIDAATACVADGGLLLVTCTDMAVLAGNHGETGYAKYSSYTHHTSYGHEQALRTILNSLQSSASRHSRYIVPMCCLSIDFYIRVFVRVYESVIKVKDSASNLCYITQCSECPFFTTSDVGRRLTDGKKIKYQVPLAPTFSHCPECDAVCHFGGPVWGGAIHDVEFTQRLHDRMLNEEQHPFITTRKRAGAMLGLALKELPTVYYVKLDDMFRAFKLSACKQEIITSALINAGYEVSASHCKKGTFKTNASMQTVFDVFRAHVDNNPYPKLPTSPIALRLLSKKAKNTYDFTVCDTLSKKQRTSALRFPLNEQKHWGPKSRAVIKRQRDEDIDKEKAGEVPISPAKKQRTDSEWKGCAIM